MTTGYRNMQGTLVGTRLKQGWHKDRPGLLCLTLKTTNNYVCEGDLEYHPDPAIYTREFWSLMYRMIQNTHYAETVNAQAHDEGC